MQCCLYALATLALLKKRYIATKYWFLWLWKCNLVFKLQLAKKCIGAKSWLLCKYFKCDKRFQLYVVVGNKLSSLRYKNESKPSYLLMPDNHSVSKAQLLSHHYSFHKVCHGFRLTKWDDYFQVAFGHFWIERCFLGHLGQFQKLALSLKPNHHKKI